MYRAAWTPERAFELLRGEAGAAFDERCVEALARVVGCPKAAEPDWVADVDHRPRPAATLRPAFRPRG